MSDGLHQRERRRRLGRRFDARQQLNPRVAPCGRHDPREELVAAPIEDRHGIADAEPQHARQVLGFVARKVDGFVTGIERGGEESMHAHEGGIISSGIGDQGSGIRMCAILGRVHMFFRDQIIGKYKILSTIGSGGFGTVYLAEDTWIDKKVALKVPHRQGVDFGELLREPRLLASLNHPNIVTIMTAEKQENVFFIVMEYVPGETLESMIARDGRARHAACARLHLPDLQRARSRASSRRPAPGSAAVERPGLRAAACSRWPTSAPRGFSRSPRMERRSSAARRTWRRNSSTGKALFASDIYSLGVTMFQMLTGDLPYDTPSPADLDRLLRGELLISVRSRNPKVPRRSTTSC